MLVYNEVLRRTEMGKKRKKNYSITVEVVCKVGRGENSYNASIQGMASDAGRVRTFPKGKRGAQGTTRGGRREAGERMKCPRACGAVLGAVRVGSPGWLKQRLVLLHCAPRPVSQASRGLCTMRRGPR